MNNKQAPKFCLYCGKELSPDSKFCPRCSKPVGPPPSKGSQIKQKVQQKKDPNIHPPGVNVIQPGGGKRKGPKVGLIVTLCIVMVAASILSYLSFFGKLNVLGILSGSQNIQIKIGKAEEKQPDEGRVIQTKDWGEAPANQVIIIFKDGVDRKAAEDRIKSIGGRIVGEMEVINLYQVETDGKTEADLNTALSKAKSLEGVENVFPNTRVYIAAGSQAPCGPLSDPFYGVGQNGRPNEITGLQNAWNIIKASGISLNNIQVGVMDSALYKKSGEIDGESEIAGDKTEDPSKDDKGNIIDGGLNHGTMVTHVIAADGKNGGMSGVASILGSKMKVRVKNIYSGKSITPTKPNPVDPTVYTGSNGKAYVANTLVKIQKIVEESGATIINCSFGPKEPSVNNAPMAGAYKKFFEYMAIKHPKVIFVAAAGNEGNKDKTQGGIDGTNYWPGGLKLPNVITVGAIDNEGNRAGFSNFASGNGEVSISAPGVKLPLGYGDDGNIVNASGTSFATPQVAGAAALIRSINPELSAAQIKEILTGTAAPSVTGKDRSVRLEQGMGKGVLNIEDAVLKAINDMRAGKGLAPFNKNKLLALSIIDASATGGPKDFKVTASIKEVGEKPAAVKIELIGGEGAIGGGSGTKTLSSPGAVSWNVTLARNFASIKLTRLDTGG